MYEKKPPGQSGQLREAAAAYVPGESHAEWVAAGAFKTHCLRLIEQVHRERGEVVVTRYGKPVARLVPYDAAPPSLFGHLAGTVLYEGDVVSPTGAEWEADA